MKRQIVLFSLSVLVVFFLFSTAYGQDNDESAWDELYKSQQTQEDTGHSNDAYELGEAELDKAEKEMETKDKTSETPPKHGEDVDASETVSKSDKNSDSNTSKKQPEQKKSRSLWQWR